MSPLFSPRDAERNRPPLVRAHLDGDRPLRPAEPFGLSVLVGLGSSLSLRHFAALTYAVRPLTAFALPLFLRHPRGSAVALCHPVNAYDKVLFTSWGGTPHGYTAPGGTHFALDNFTFNVPEPSTFALLATGLASLLFMAWRRRKRNR